MKKGVSILVGLLISSIGVSQAQIKNDRGTFTKPGAGEWTFETQMTLNVTGGGVFSLNDGFLQGLDGGLDRDGVLGEDGGGSRAYLPLIRARKFTSDKVAHRYLLNISFATDGQKSGGVKSSTTQLGVALGYGVEKHQAGAERLCTYYGVDGMLGFASISAKNDDDKNSNSGFGVGVRAFTGMEYYFIPKVYLGLELGWGLGANFYGKTKVGDDDNDTNRSQITLTPYVLPSFRLGYRL